MKLDLVSCKHRLTQISFQNEFILVVALDRTFQKYHIKAVRTHSGTELGTWMEWADQQTDTFNPSMFLFQNENFYVNVELLK